MAIVDKSIKKNYSTSKKLSSQFSNVENKKELNNKTTSIKAKNENTLSLEELNLLKDEISNKSDLLTQIIEISTASRKYFKAADSYSQLFEDAKNLTLEKVAFFAVNFRNQLSNSASFQMILRQSQNNFEGWFKNFIEYTLLIRLTDYYNQVLTSLANLRDYKVFLPDREINRKATIKFIEQNLLASFKEFLSNEWKEALVKNVAYNKKRDLVEKTTLR